jgi:hypothetical protein
MTGSFSWFLWPNSGGKGLIVGPNLRVGRDADVLHMTPSRATCLLCKDLIILTPTDMYIALWMSNTVHDRCIYCDQDTLWPGEFIWLILCLQIHVCGIKLWWGNNNTKRKNIKKSVLEIWVQYSRRRFL